MNNKISAIVFVFLLAVSINSIGDVAKINPNKEEFRALIFPSIADREMDFWYKIPPNSGPQLSSIKDIYQNQKIDFLVFFSGYSLDNDNAHIEYDVEFSHPDDKEKPTQEAKNILGFKGVVKNKKALIASKNNASIVFDKTDRLGKYDIKLIAYDKVSNKVFKATTSLNLLAFSIPKAFESQKEVNKWLDSYHIRPDPIKSISALKFMIKTEAEWINKNLHTLALFKKIFSDNPFLFSGIANQFDTLSETDKKKVLLISAITEGSEFSDFKIINNKQEYFDFYKLAQKTKIPNTEEEIVSAVQLDVLWAEFLVTGKYAPIRKIVSALKLYKHIGVLEKIKNKELSADKDTFKKAYLEATHGAATWSLMSQAKNIPLVYKYLIFMYKNEKLDNTIKAQLGAILNKVQKGKNKTNAKTGDK